MTYVSFNNLTFLIKTKIGENEYELFIKGGVYLCPRRQIKMVAQSKKVKINQSKRHLDQLTVKTDIINKVEKILGAMASQDFCVL